ncbi:hypothetical protein D3C72_2001030 [compost metagenome]
MAASGSKSMVACWSAFRYSAGKAKGRSAEPAKSSLARATSRITSVWYSGSQFWFRYSGTL